MMGPRAKLMDFIRLSGPELGLGAPRDGFGAAGHSDIACAGTTRLVPGECGRAVGLPVRSSHRSRPWVPAFAGTTRLGPGGRGGAALSWTDASLWVNVRKIVPAFPFPFSPLHHAHFLARRPDPTVQG